MTVDALAQELGIAPSTLRAWLRKTYPRDPSARRKPWNLTDEHCAAARERWRAQEPVAVAVAEEPAVAVLDEPPPSSPGEEPILQDEPAPEEIAPELEAAF